MKYRVKTSVLLLAAFLLRAVARAAHPLVAYSKRLSVEPQIFVNDLALDNSGTAYLAWVHSYSGGAYVSRVDASGQLWTVRIGGVPSEQVGPYFDDASAVANGVNV
jgi:hypothetical protein